MEFKTRLSPPAVSPGSRVLLNQMTRRSQLTTVPRLIGSKNRHELIREQTQMSLLYLDKRWQFLQAKMVLLLAFAIGAHTPMTLRPKCAIRPAAAVDATRNAEESIHSSYSDAAMEKNKPTTSKSKKNKYTLAVLSQLVGLIAIVAALILAAQLASTKEKGYDSDSYACIDEDLTTKKAAIDSFLEWFDAAGGTRHAGIGIANFPDMGNAYQAIEEHEQLLFVPMKTTICRDTIFEAIPSSLQSKLVKLRDDDDALLTAFLLLELAKNESSFWFPYLQLLPRLPDTAASPLLYVSLVEVHALQDERMIAAALKERQHAKRGLQKFRRLFKSLPNLNQIDLQAYSWARFLISSRAFAIRGQRFLVPFGDVFNGQRHPKTRSFDNGQRFLQYHHFASDGMVIRADRATSANHQIFEDYGDNSNYIYFLYHGFVMPDTDSSKFDCAAFRFPQLQEATDNNEEVLALKMQVLHHFGVANGPLACIAHDGTLSHDTQQLAQFYFTLVTTDASAMMKECRMKTDYARCFVPTTSSANMMTEEEDAEYGKFLACAIETQLRQSYPTTVNEDIEIQGNGSVPKSQRAAVEFCNSRKRTLQRALGNLQERQLAIQKNKDTVDMTPTDKEDTASTTTLQEEDDGDDAQRLTRFQEWLTAQNLPINHVELRFINPGMGYGTFAT
ncbi:Histone-lysine n-methyltransferase setd3, partial [Globisporangium splendens]